MALPPPGYISDPARSVAEMKQALEDIRDAIAAGVQLPFILGSVEANDSPHLTILGFTGVSRILIWGDDLRPTANAARLLLRLGDGGIDSGADHYMWHRMNVSAGSAAYAAKAAATDTLIELGDDVGNAARKGISFAVELSQHSTTKWPMLGGFSVIHGSEATDPLRGGFVMGQRRAQMNPDRVRLSFAPGDVSSGFLSAYAISF